MLKVTSGLLSTGVNAYSDEGASKKDAFHKEGKAFLRKLAKELGLGKEDYDLRGNVAGIAVSGEVTLHTEKLYVQLSESVTSRGVQALYRECNGRKDYTGGTNNFAKLLDLHHNPEHMNNFVARCHSLQHR